MKISFLINNYNYEAYVDQAIQSVLAQTYKNIELIIVDDGSTDNSREIIERYRDVATVVFKKNGGQASAFNAGVEKATGDWIMFLDADDIIKPQLAETIAALPLKETVAKVHWRMEVIDAKNQFKGVYCPDKMKTLPSGNVRNTLVTTGETNYPPTSGNVFNARMIKAIFPIPEAQWRIATDTYVNDMAPLHGEIFHCTESLSCYRIHGDNLWASTKCEADRLKREVGLIDKSIKLIEQEASISVDRKRHFSQLFVELNLCLHDESFVPTYQSKRRQARCLIMLLFTTPHVTKRARVIWFIWLTLYSISPRLLRFKGFSEFRTFLADKNII